jgi:outer membrane receptor for ferrienterochelin and colicins
MALSHKNNKKLPYLVVVTAVVSSVLVNHVVALPTEERMEALRHMSLSELLDITIVTASKHEERISETPVPVRMITREQIRARRYFSLADVLHDLPGIDFQRGTKSSSFNNPIFQGNESNNKFLILQNGVRIDHPAGGKLPVAENFPLYHAKQIEILYGPAAALYGADAFAGVINIITETAATQEGLSVASRMGENAYSYHQAMLGIKLNDSIALSLGGHKHATDRAFLPDFYPKDFKQSDALNFGGEVVIPAAQREDYRGGVKSRSAYTRLDVGENFSLVHQYSFFRSLTSTGDRPDTALFLDEAAWHTQINTTYAHYALTLNPNISAYFMLNHSIYEVSPQSKYINIFTNYQDHGYDYARSRKNEAESQITWRINDTHTLMTGLSHANYFTREMPDMPRPLDPRYSATQQGLFYEHTDLPITDLQAHYHNNAAYAQLRSHWNRQFSTNIGLRYDDNSAYGGSFNPRIGIVYQHTPQHLFKLLYGEGIRAPSSEESFSTFGVFSGERNAEGEYIGTGFRVPNLNMEPEKMRSLSALWEWQFHPNARLSLNPYYATIDNLIETREESIATQFIPGAELRKTTIKDNLNQEYHYGLDLELGYRYQGTAWQSEVWGGYSYIDGGIKERSGARWDLPYISHHKIKLGSTLRYQGDYFITPKLYYFSAANSGRKDRAHAPQRIQTPGYFLMDMHMGMENVFKNLSFYVDIYNLFDRRYYNPGGSGSTTFIAMPQQPRHLILGLEYRFF